MDQLLIVIPLGLLVLCIILPLLRFGETAAARYWALAWILLYVDGIFSGFSLESRASLLVAQVMGLGFAISTFLGARALNGGKSKGLIVPGGIDSMPPETIRYSRGVPESIQARITATTLSGSGVFARGIWSPTMPSPVSFRTR